MSKIWIWSAAGLLVINLVIVGIVAFLIHRDSTQSDRHAQSLIGSKVVTLLLVKVNANPLTVEVGNFGF